MALKAILKDLNEVPEAQRSLYKQEGDLFVLDLDGDSVKEHPAARALKNALEEEKESRRKANKKADDLAKDFDKYKDIDPEKAREALKKLQELDDKKLIDEGKLDELVNQRVERIKADFGNQIGAKDGRIKELETALGSRDTELADIKIFTAVKDAAIAKNVRKTALDDVVNRAKPVFKLVDGKVVPYKPGSKDDVWFGKKGDPMEITEWVELLAADAPHLFEASGGGGAGGGKGGGGGNADVKRVSRADAGLYINEIAEGKAAIAD